MRRMILASGLALVSAFALIAAPVAGATTYNNDEPITIPPNSTASPYPSSITVVGMAGPITDVNVGLDGLTSPIPDDIAIALVAPSGQSLKIQDCAGGTTPASAVFLTFDDAAAAKLPDDTPLATGTFKPTSHCFDTTTFPAPGPLASYGNPGPGLGGTATFASAFNGLSAIGTWNLYVFDPQGGGAGSIPGGWSLDVTPDVLPLPTVNPNPNPNPTPTPAPTKKCKKKKAKGKKGVAAAAKCKKKKKKK